MTTDPVEILSQRNAEVEKIRGYADLTEEAKNRRIAEVNERARAEHAEALEAAKREREERLERTRKAVFRVPVGPTATDAEEAQILASYRAAFNDVYSSTRAPENPQEVQEELERYLRQAERTGDKLLAAATYHRAIDLGIQPIVDSYLSSRPAEERAWDSYTEAHKEAEESKGVGFMLERALGERALE